MTIRRLTVDDLPAMYAVMDRRKKFQLEETIDDKRHQQLKEHLVTNRIRHMSFHFFGSFDDQGDLQAFGSFNRILIPWNYNIGVAYAVPGLPRWPGSHAPAVLIDIRNHGTDYFRSQYMTTAWNVRPNHPDWLRAGGADLMNPLKYERELFCVLPPNTKMVDPMLQQEVMLGGTLPFGQAIFKFYDLNYLPIPEFATHLPPQVPRQ